MATVSNNTPSQANPIMNQRADNKQTDDKTGKDSNDNLKKTLEKLLRTYEKGKAELWHKILEATTETHQDLAAALKDNPVAALSSPDSARDGSGMVKDIENFFMLIFKFLKDHKEGQSKMELAQAVNTQGKEKLLASVTKAAMNSVTHMKKQIDEANKKKHGVLGSIMIALSVIITVICIAAAIFTGGASVGAAAAADVALDTAAAATEAGVAAGLEAGSAATEAGTAAMDAADAASAVADGSVTVAEGTSAAE